MKRRLTRSSEDLTISENLDINSRRNVNSIDEANSVLIERSTSFYTNVIAGQKSGSAVIILPKDFNPVAKLQCVENMELFIGKTFYHTKSNNDIRRIDNDTLNKTELRPKDDYPVEYNDAPGFTNQIFSDSYEVSIRKSGGKNFKQVIAERRFRELQILGCLIVEMFLLNRLRPMNLMSFKERLQSCHTILHQDGNALPKCVQYPVKLFLQNQEQYEKFIITEKGLPNPSAHQLIQPLLSNSLFPFPLSYIQIYSCIKSLHQFTLVFRNLNLFTFFECDGKSCGQFEMIDKMRASLHRKIAECKVNSCVTQIEGLLDPIGFEQFIPIELLLPHIIDLIRNDDTSIMSAWHLFDPVATALGITQSRKFLLEPILQLYDSESDERITFLNSNFDQSMKFTTSTAFKSKKSYKLYHHTFLLKLIVRFGLKCFLENFIAPLIEGVGGYKDPGQSCSFHGHENSFEIRRKSSKNLDFSQEQTIEEFSEQSKTLISPNSDRSSDKTLSPNSEKDDASDQLKTEEIFDFENENDNLRGQDTSEAILQIIDNFDIKSESTLDLCLNHSQAEEATEDTPINDENYKITDVISGEEQLTFYSDFCQVNLSFDEDVLSFHSNDSPQKSPGIIGSVPSLPIPATYIAGRELSTIGCEIGSKKSIDSSEIDAMHASVMTSTSTTPTVTASTPTKATRPSRIAEVSSVSLTWLSHRLGPVLTARFLSRNLLKMLTLCYVGQENLFPDSCEGLESQNLLTFSIADGRVVGDQNATKVLECLTSISALYGEQFILLQYFPHVSELIALCKKRITVSLEGGLISSLQLLKYLISYLSDATIMDQLHDIILRSIIHPIIRLLGSSRCLMPSSYLSRNVLARKLIDTLYVIAIRIGPVMTREHLCVPALQRFFFIFNKAYGLNVDNSVFETSKKPDASPNDSADESNFVEIRRDGGIREWSIEAGSPIKFKFARPKNAKNSFDSITPPVNQEGNADNNSLKKRAMDEIRDVFTPNLAHTAYLTFLKFLGDNVMLQTVKNLELILNLCHEHEQSNQSKFESTNIDIPVQEDNDDTSMSFGSVIGNRIEVQPGTTKTKSDVPFNDIIDMVTYKLEQTNTVRHLRGNWLAYWEHEIGRADKDNHFNLKQIKLQSFHGHTNSVRTILPLDNENSFMSASKDKTVKLWSLRSEGDGNKITQCQYTYTNHKKSVHSLTFLESHRLTISCDSGVHLWDPFVGQQISQLDSPRFSPVTVVRTIPAPSSLVICGTADASIKTIDTRTFNYINEWKISSTPTGSVRCMAISPNGIWIAVGLSSGQITIIDAKSGIIIASWKANDGELLQLVAPNEQQLISSSLDHSISVWSSSDGSLLFQMKSPPEPAHCLIHNNNELITGTPANRIGVYTSIANDANYSIAKLRSENFRGVLTTLAVLPLNRMLLIGGDSGNISLLC